MGSRKCLKISCAITIILLLIIVGVMLILYFTILKPKQPILIPQSVTLQDLDVVSLNFTLGIMITVDNRNYGSFKYHNATSYINYHGTRVGNALLAPDTIPARAKHNISTSLEVLGDRLVMNTYFLVDFAREVMNFTASTALNGQVKVLKFIKKKATSYTTCNISISLKNWTADSVCKYKLKL